MCPHCKGLFDKRNAGKWHFDNCLLNPNGNKRIKTNFIEGNTYGCKKILEIESNKVFNSIKDAADYFKVSLTTITRWAKKEVRVKYYK